MELEHGLMRTNITFNPSQMIYASTITICTPRSTIYVPTSTINYTFSIVPHFHYGGFLVRLYFKGIYFGNTSFKRKTLWQFICKLFSQIVYNFPYKFSKSSKFRKTHFEFLLLLNNVLEFIDVTRKVVQTFPTQKNANIKLLQSGNSFWEKNGLSELQRNRILFSVACRSILTCVFWLTE